MPNRKPTYVHQKTGTGMWLVVLFVVIPNWKPSECFSIVEWVGKLWYSSIIRILSVMEPTGLTYMP